MLKQLTFAFAAMALLAGMVFISHDAGATSKVLRSTRTIDGSPITGMNEPTLQTGPLTSSQGGAFDSPIARTSCEAATDNTHRCQRDDTDNMRCVICYYKDTATNDYFSGRHCVFNTDVTTPDSTLETRAAEKAKKNCEKAP